MLIWIFTALIWVSIVLDVIVLVRMTKVQGEILVTSDDELYLELRVPVEKIRKRKFVKFHVTKVDTRKNQPL